MPKRDAKAERLKALGVLNPSPQRVRAAWFEVGGFFDARDLVQVKYEMLRHANREGAAKADAAKQVSALFDPGEQQKRDKEEADAAEALLRKEEDALIAVRQAEADLAAGSAEKKPLLEAKLAKAKRAHALAVNMRTAAGLPELP